MADIITNDCPEHKGWRGDVECPYCLRSKLDEERQYSERMLAAYQEAHRQATENGAAYHALASRLEQCQRVVGFFASVIQSGEPWTDHCQAAFDGVIRPSRDVERKGNV